MARFPKVVKPTAGVAALEHEPLVSNGENIKFKKGIMLKSLGISMLISACYSPFMAANMS